VDVRDRLGGVGGRVEEHDLDPHPVDAAGGVVLLLEHAEGVRLRLTEGGGCARRRGGGADAQRLGERRRREAHRQSEQRGQRSSHPRSSLGSVNGGASHLATTGLTGSCGCLGSTPSKGLPSSNQLLGAGWPQSVCLRGSSSVHLMGANSGSIVR